MRKWVLLAIAAILGATGAQEMKAEDCKKMTKAEIIELLRKTPFGPERREIAEKYLTFEHETSRCCYFDKDEDRVFVDCDNGKKYWQRIDGDSEWDENRNLIPDDKE